MKASELRDLNVDALQNELVSLLREQFNLRMQHGTGQLVRGTHNLRTVRKNIARVLTVLRQKKAS